MTHHTGAFGHRAIWILIASLAVGSLGNPASAQAQAGDACDPGIPDRRAQPGVYLYSGNNFSGRCTRFTEDVENLIGTGVGNDSVSSIYIVGWYAATLYRGARYGSNQSTFLRSDGNIADSFVGSDLASSLRVRGYDCDGEPGVYLFWDSNYSGPCSKFTADTLDFRILLMQPGEASSIRIVGDWVATVYSQVNFGGTHSRFDANDVNFGDNVIGHDQAHSIQITPAQRVCDGGPGVYLYAGWNYLSPCSRFTSSVGDLSQHRIGEDTASSIRVTRGYQATVYSSRSRGGQGTTFAANDPDLSDNRVGDDRASSIVVTGPNPEQAPILRLQMRIETGDVEDAGTDDDIMVSLNPENFTWLDYGRDDFERGDNYTYDLRLDELNQVSSIKWITINKTGEDGWCLKSFDLRINYVSPPDATNADKPVVLFRQEYPTCRWLDNEGSEKRTLVIPFGFLRAQSSWQQAQVPPQRFSIDSTELVSRIEGIVGHELHDQARAFWGESYGESVEIYGVNDPNDRNDRVHVDLDLAGSLDPTALEVDVDFDLLITCEIEKQTAHLHLQLANADAQLNYWILDWLAGGVEERIEKAIPTLEQSADTGLSACPAIIVRGDGTITPGLAVP